MRTHGRRPKQATWKARCTVLLSVLFSARLMPTPQAQEPAPRDVAAQIQQLTTAMTAAQARLEDSQRQLDEMQRQLLTLQQHVAQNSSPAAKALQPQDSVAAADNRGSSSSVTSELQDLRERQEMQAAQIATHEQAKVESESKYPVKITGLLLLNGFVNSGGVDTPATPTAAVEGPGSSGASVRQTLLGFEASGPRLFGARSYADLHVDFNGTPQSSSADAYSYSLNTTTLLRLRTAHAGLQWEHTAAYFALDRPILSPDTPTSLTAMAQPALAWSGNLWAWNPQAGVTHDLPLRGAQQLRLQAALIDVGNAPLSPSLASTEDPLSSVPSDAELSRSPGAEARIAWQATGLHREGPHVGIGGYFAPHHSSLGRDYNAWAGTLDARWLLPARLEFTGSFYRGAVLGGLGAGGYKDFAYSARPNSAGYFFRPLNDVGGWAQLKEKFSERIEVNAAFGLDNVFAHDLTRYISSTSDTYSNLARNRTFTANAIYSPSAYLLFSLEYRRLESFPAVGVHSTSNVVGVAAGYKF